MSSVSELNEMLVSRNCLQELDVRLDENKMSYDLVSALSDQLGGHIVRIKFNDIASLAIRDFGGGLTQLMHMSVCKLDGEWDRIRYQLVEVEGGNLSFYFSSLSID